MSKEEFLIRAPARACLFGEHQDYLGLPVISAAISLFIEIKAEKIDEKKLIIDLPNLKQQETIPLINKEVPYQYERDYIRSSYNLFVRKGFSLHQGYHCEVQGDIPMSAGAGSSSALVIAWITFLARIFNVELSEGSKADLGYQAEIDEFRGPGGRMDHFTSALGGLLYITTTPPFGYERLTAPLTGLVLGDSLENKDTISDLTRVKEMVYIAMGELRRKYEQFDLKTTTVKEISLHLEPLFPEVAKKIKANLINRNLTQVAKNLLSSKEFNPKTLGDLLNQHHEQLAKNLGISTPKIEKLITAAKDAGAFGCKINGSGFGGSIIAYAPESTEEVARAIEKAGGKAYIISIAEGCKVIES
ncbi:MAG: GHMP kinase [Candidatus Helarchaeota archaeon]|nr:GHMP kinase [Candidatus Helarchaeota archaeon]